MVVSPNGGNLLWWPFFPLPSSKNRRKTCCCTQEFRTQPGIKSWLRLYFKAASKFCPLLFFWAPLLSPPCHLLHHSFFKTGLFGTVVPKIFPNWELKMQRRSWSSPWPVEWSGTGWEGPPHLFKVCHYILWQPIHEEWWCFSGGLWRGLGRCPLPPDCQPPPPFSSSHGHLAHWSTSACSNQAGLLVWFTGMCEWRVL